MTAHAAHRFCSRAIISAIVWACAQPAWSQCGNNNTLTGSAISVACPGTTTVPCVQGGQYALVNVTLGNIYTFSTCTSGAFDSQVTVYNNTGGASLGYSDDACGLFGTQSSVQWTATFSGQVRVLVDEYNCVSNATCIPLTIQCAAPPPPVTNDNPCQAQSVAVTSTCVPSTWSNIGGTLTTNPVVPAPGCGSLGAGTSDVWFVFTAPPTGIAIIETGAGTLTDAAMALYQATPNCSGSYNLIECNDDQVNGDPMPLLSFSNLIPGQQYYLRVWGYGTATGSFTLCIHGPTTIPSGNCVYILQLFDSFGDGWDGSSVSVTINGVPYGTYTNTGSYDVFLIGVNIGQVLVLQYTAAGFFESDNSYTLGFLSTGQTVFNSGTPPGTGVVYSTTITCNPPPAAPEDCVGSITLCNSLGVNNNTNNTGSVADLNASNYGCLLSSEVQGTWYNFSVSSSGTLGFTIDPSAPDAGYPDYDWAIWGPFPPGSTTTGMCPPIGTPIRCSYASGPSTWSATGGMNTGMGINNATWASPQYAAALPAYSDPAGGDGWTPGLNVSAGQVYLMYVSNFSATGQSFALGWQLGAGASLDCTVLQTHLLSFSATSMERSVTVEWVDANEMDADRFNVLRSKNGVDFALLGSVPGGMATTSTVQHEFVDPSPLDGLSYYALDIVDLDGTRQRSPTVVVVRTDGSLTSIFPSPVTDLCYWALPNAADVDHVVVLDALGREVRRIGGPFTAGTLTLNASDWPTGTYTVVAMRTNDDMPSRSTLIKY